MAEGPIDFDPTTEEGASDINIDDDYDSLQPYEDETQDTWWKRVGPRMRRFSTSVIEKIWRDRGQWEQHRAEYIPLLEREEKQDRAINMIKEKFINPKTDKFIVNVDDLDRVTVKLKKSNSKAHAVIDADGNLLDIEKLPKTLKEYLGDSVIEKAEDNDAEIQRNSTGIQNNRAILEDQNSSEGDKEAASSRINDLETQNEVLEQENEALEERLTLKEKVKRIFKKYGVTVVGVFLATSAIVTAIIEVISRRLGQVANGVGNGLKAIGKKLSELLPGIIGSVVSFLFRTAGQVVSFLGKNASLLIVAVVVFLIERIKSKSSK